MNGDPKFSASQDLPAFPFAKYAEMLGLEGIELNSPDQIASAWTVALSADRPVVIEAHCDPDVPPLPPHFTFDQVKGFLSSLVKRDPNLGGIVAQSAKQMMSTLLSRSDKKES
jgi:pyruvate dehydrogenase (quinone)